MDVITNLFHCTSFDGAAATACMKRFEDLQPYMHLSMDDCTVEDDESDGDDSTTNPNVKNPRRIPLVDLIPSPSEQRKIFALLNEMSAFDVIACRLQRKDVTITTVRDTFDVVLDDHEDMDYCLAAGGEVVECPDFEAGLAKIQCGAEKTLLVPERHAVARLLRSPAGQSDQRRNTVPASLPKRKRTAGELDQAIAKKARNRGTKESKYIEANWIPTTFVVAERFSSMVKSSIGYLRKSMSASTLETVMFLKLNWDLVTLGSVSAAIENSKNTEWSNQVDYIDAM
ncbi:hypothetical protein F444_05582 [Phytophthora nicotianae P1976]|uniref:HAT C-terminal dimerisation domain-containing protein n=2 Tax=Phytophthora nicotianae TaxID=4792 RepID=A0A081ALM6_PHYNI|nr:hypothetical protein F444_05582 [Phytophthora nicotianae P1976]